MVIPVVSDVISIVGFAYLQPIADLLEKLLAKPISGKGPAGSSEHENGYSSAIIILLVAVVESYTARLRFVRSSEGISGNCSVPELLGKYFQDLPLKSELCEVFIIRNTLSHNHVWHFDISDFNSAGASTLATPKELGFNSNKSYELSVNIESRTTNILKLNIAPTLVDRNDVYKVFDVIWSTLKFMNGKSFCDTPLAGSTVRFNGMHQNFENLLQSIKHSCEESKS